MPLHADADYDGYLIVANSRDYSVLEMQVVFAFG